MGGDTQASSWLLLLTGSLSSLMSRGVRTLRSMFQKKKSCRHGPDPVNNVQQLLFGLYVSQAHRVAFPPSHRLSF